MSSAWLLRLYASTKLFKPAVALVIVLINPHWSGTVRVLVYDWPRVYLDDGVWAWRVVAQCTVRSSGVVMSSPLLD